MQLLTFFKKHTTARTIAILLCILFFIAYSILAIVRHTHYQSFGYDLGINHQVVWKYSTFQAPVTTTDPFPESTKLAAHVELVYILIAPFYWIWNSPITLLLVQTAWLCSSGIAVYLLARKRKLLPLVSLAALFAYLMFFGIQNALWFDVHSASFAAGFLAWFVYFLDNKNYRVAWIFLLLAITAKENIGLLTMLISLVYLIRRKEKQLLWMLVISLSYLLFIYLIYFPHIIQQSYLYQNQAGLLSNLNPISLFDTAEKRETLLYAFAAFGFIPILYPLTLLPIVGDFATYFILASDLQAAHGIFMHYRVTLAPLLVWGTILTISQYKRLNKTYIAVYLVLCALVIQYLLHLPLSYLVKTWFWTQPSGVTTINELKDTLAPTDAVVAQNNIIPHISSRDKIYTLYPEKKQFMNASPCGQETCDWFRWHGEPTYLLVDTSPEWDARHFLTDRESYLKALENIEEAQIVTREQQKDNTVLYKVNNNPASLTK